jgi:hypothetical protein
VVKLSVTAGKEVSFSDTIEISTQSLCVSEVTLPAVVAGESFAEVNIAANVADPRFFQFLSIRPVLLGKEPVKPSDLIIKDTVTANDPGCAFLEYSGPKPAEYKGDWKPQRKPLRGTHTFAVGQTEWVTDMLAGGSPGGLTKLLFWYRKPVATEADMSDAAKDKFLKVNGVELQGDERGKAVAKWADGRHDITIQIVAGYSPIVVKAEPCLPEPKKC